MSFNVQFWQGPSPAQPRRYHKNSDWEPHKGFILQKRAEGAALEDIVTSLKIEKQLDIEVHQLKHVLRTWRSAVRISGPQRRYIVSSSLQRRAAGKRRTVFRYVDTSEKIPKDKVERILKRYKNELQGQEALPPLEIIAQTPSAPSINSRDDNVEDDITPLQRAAAKWLQEDSTLTPIEETLMAMSLIGDTGIPDLYQLMDSSVPNLPKDSFDQASSEVEDESEGILSNISPIPVSPQQEATPAATPQDEHVLEDALRDHVEHAEAFSAPVEFMYASKMLRPICMDWIERVKRNMLNVGQRQLLSAEPTDEEIERLGYTPTEASEALPTTVCATIVPFLGDKDPLPNRSSNLFSMDWQPVSKIFQSAIPLLWGLFSGTSAFQKVKLYLDDVARIFYLPTMVTKYGVDHYFTIRALQSFGMCLALVCHLEVSTDILEMAVKGFDRIGMSLHQHTVDCCYQLAQVSPFSGRGQQSVQLAQSFLRRSQLKYGLRHGRTLSGIALLARALLAQRQKQLALNLLAQASRIINSLQEKEKKSKQYADALRDLGKAEFYSGMAKKATLTLTDALQRNDDLGHRAPDSSHLSFLIGMIHIQSQSWEDSIKFLRRSTMYRSDTFGEFHRASASSMEALSTAWERRGMVLYETPFLELLEKLYRHYEKRFGGEHPRTWNAWYRYGAAALVDKRPIDAQPREVIEIS